MQRDPKLVTQNDMFCDTNKKNFEKSTCRPEDNRQDRCENHGRDIIVMQDIAHRKL